ncbi:hypothetical protein L208DRAFT_1384715, partial [Tricholoma matsutake]
MIRQSYTIAQPKKIVQARLTSAEDGMNVNEAQDVILPERCQVCDESQRYRISASMSRCSMVDVTLRWV